MKQATDEHVASHTHLVPRPSAAFFSNLTSLLAPPRQWRPYRRVHQEATGIGQGLLPSGVKATSLGIQPRGAADSQRQAREGAFFPCRALSATPLFLAHGSMYSGLAVCLEKLGQATGVPVPAQTGNVILPAQPSGLHLQHPGGSQTPAASGHRLRAGGLGGGWEGWGRGGSVEGQFPGRGWGMVQRCCLCE